MAADMSTHSDRTKPAFAHRAKAAQSVTRSTRKAGLLLFQSVTKRTRTGAPIFSYLHLILSKRNQR